MKQIILLFTLLLYLNPIAGYTYQHAAFDPSLLSREGQQAYQILLKVELLNLGGSGMAAQFTDGEMALRTLLRETEAPAAFTSLIGHAKPEGSLYALVGLRLKDTRSFKQVAERYKSLPALSERLLPHNLGGFRIPEGKVLVSRGCRVWFEDKEKIISEIESETFTHVVK